MTPHDPLDHDDAFARLRAADPSANATPDIARIRAVVDAAIASTPVDEMAQRRSRKRWFAGAAAAVAGAAIIGSGGFALGTVASSSSQSSYSAAKGESLVPTPAPAVAKDGKLAAPGNALVLGSASTAPSMSVGSSAQYDTGRQSIPTTSTVYEFTASSADVAKRVTSLAAALGFTHGPVHQRSYMRYVATSPDAKLLVNDRATASFLFTRNGTDAAYFACGGSASGIQLAMVKELTCRTATARAATVQSAVRVLASTGLAPDKYTWRYADVAGLHYVVAAPAVKGVAATSSAGRWAFVSNGSGQLVSVRGYLATPVAKSTYTLKTPGAAIADLRTQPQVTVTETLGSDVFFPAVPGMPNPGGPMVRTPAAPAKSKVTGAGVVRSVRVALYPFGGYNGTVYLLPVYVVTDSQGGEYYTNALTDSELASLTN